jgi:hypothetical protein
MADGHQDRRADWQSVVNLLQLLGQFQFRCWIENSSSVEDIYRLSGLVEILIWSWVPSWVHCEPSVAVVEAREQLGNPEKGNVRGCKPVPEDWWIDIRWRRLSECPSELLNVWISDSATADCNYELTCPINLVTNPNPKSIVTHYQRMTTAIAGNYGAGMGSNGIIYLRNFAYILL